MPHRPRVVAIGSVLATLLAAAGCRDRETEAAQKAQIEAQRQEIEQLRKAELEAKARAAADELGRVRREFDEARANEVKAKDAPPSTVGSAGLMSNAEESALRGALSGEKDDAERAQVEAKLAAAQRAKEAAKKRGQDCNCPKGDPLCSCR